MKKIIISAIGSDKPGIVSDLSKIITINNANIEESRMTVLGSDFIILMLVSIQDKFEKNFIVELKKINDLDITIKETKSKTVVTDSYIQIILNGADTEGIVNVLSKYLSNKSINILDLSTKISNAPISGAPLFNLNAITSYPKNIDINEIKSDLSVISKKLGIDIFVKRANL